MTTEPAPGPAAGVAADGPGVSVLGPVYGAGFVTAFGAHAVAANLGAYATGHRGSLWELGLLWPSTTQPRWS